MAKKTIGLVWAKAVATSKGVTSVVASTAAVDRDGDILDQSTWDLGHFEGNPVIPWNHDYSIPPVGRAKSISVKDGKLVAEIEWDQKTELGKTVARQFAEGFLSAVSVGFRAGSAKSRSELAADHPHRGDRGALLSGLELLEVSAVVVPANPQALASKYLRAEGDDMPEDEAPPQEEAPPEDEAPAVDAVAMREWLLEAILTDADVRAALGLPAAEDATEESEEPPAEDVPEKSAILRFLRGAR